jgi:L-amino acid N-acyltransferase YncA
MTLATLTLRPALPSDAQAMLDIYAPVVERTAISFELTAPTLSEFAERVRKISAGWAWLVAERDGQVIGYAYGSSHRERAAYRWSTEVTAYMAPAAQRQGIGRQLYGALLPQLAARGLCNAYAGIALPNDASVALHQSAGFHAIGTFPAVGRKFGRWHDVAWFHCRLRAEPPDASPANNSDVPA